jgi:S-layer family protein
MNRSGKVSFVLLTMFLFVLPLSIRAQSGLEGRVAPGFDQSRIAAQTYGTTSLTYLTLSPYDMQGLDSSVTFAADFLPHSIYRTNTTGYMWIIAPVKLPAGAQVVQIKLYACDTNAGSDITSALRGQPRDGTTALLTTGPTTSGLNGCGNVLQVLSTPVTIDNYTYYYWFEMNVPAADPSQRIAAVRIGYKLQISPDPPGATFADVPVGHPFHRFVEALHAAGITGGCGGTPPNFCPDAPVTRGQMAVFLAGALGLHWAP